MIFNFNGGDVLVILLVTVIIFVFRRLDTPNRRMKLVNESAQKLEAELKEIARQKSEDLKSIAHEYSVQEKNNQAILSRMEEARQTISLQTEGLENRVAQIELQEKALLELDDLMTKIDENLVRLKKESVYVDEVGTRLNDIRDKFSSLEAKDKERFEEFRRNALSLINSDFQELRSGLDEAERQLRQYQESLETLNAQRDEQLQMKLEHFHDDIERVETDYQLRLEQAAEKGAALENRAFTALNKKIESQAVKLKERWLNDVQTLKKEVSTAVGEVKKNLVSVNKTKSDVETVYKALDGRIGTAVSKAESCLRDIEGLVRDKSAEFEDSLKNLDSRLLDKAGNLQNYLEERLQVAEEGASRNTMNMITSELQGVKNSLEEADRQLRNYQDTLDNLNTQRDEEGRRKLDRFQDDIERMEAAYRKSLQNAADKGVLLEDEVFSALNKDIESRTVKLKESWQNGIQTLKEEVSASVEDVRTMLANVRQEMADADALHQELDGSLKASADKSEASLQEMEQLLQASASSLESRLSELEVRLQKKAENLSHAAEERIHAVNEDIESSLNKLGGEIRLETESLSQKMEELENFLQTTAEKNSSWLDETAENQQKALSEFNENLAHLQEKLGEASDNLEENLQNLEKKMQAGSKEIYGQMEKRINSIGENIFSRMEQNLKSSANTIHARLEEKLEAASDKFETTLSSLNERIQSDTDMFQINLDKLKVRISQFVENKESDFLGDIELQQNSYRKDVEKRFEQIEGFIRDMDSLAESLRASQQDSLREAELVFRQFNADMDKVREKDKEKFAQDTAVIQQEIAALEQELDELKSRAYDNVSEKLQVFEGDFFADLQSRSEQMRQALEEWRSTANRELGEFRSQVKQEYEDTRKQQSADLKESISNMQTSVFGQLETFHDRIDSFKDSFHGQLQTAEQDIANFRAELTGRIEEEKAASNGEFQKAFDAFDKQTEGKLERARKVIANKFEDFIQEIDHKNQLVNSEFQKVRDDVSKWMEQFKHQISDAEHDADNKIESMKFNFTAKMTELKDEYETRTSQLIMGSEEERGLLRRDIADLVESVNQLSLMLAEKSRDALDAVKDESEKSILEFHRNSRKAMEDVEHKAKELGQSVQESRERADAHRVEILAQLDSEHTRLMQNLDEIEKRQQEFIAQTHIFERADKLKAALETDIAELSDKLNSVNAGREELQGMNDKYEHVLNLYTEVSDTMSRFIAEQHKIERLEGKIISTVQLSETVDFKLSKMNEANTSLQDFQIRLKNLEDLSADLKKQYDALSEQTTIIDAASARVDKNVRHLMELEQFIDEIDKRLAPLRTSMDNAESTQKDILENADKINSVMAQLSALDTTIKELDKRLKEQGKVRDWLAKAETRLEEINDEIRQYLRLRTNISSSESHQSSSSPPDIADREVVMKLARQGWTSEEIAFATKLSRSEVELILELMPKKE